MQSTERELTEKLTIKQAADLYGLTKAAIRLRMERLPESAVTRTPSGTILLCTNQIVTAWGLPPAPQDTHSTPQGAQVDEDGATTTEPQSAPQSDESASTTTTEREQLHRLQAKVETLQQELAEAKRETAEALKRAEDLTDQLHAAEAERDRIQAEMEGMSAAVDLLNRERETMQAHIATLTETIKAQSAQLTEEQRLLDQTHHVIAMLSQKALPAPRRGLLSRIFGRDKQT